MVFDKTPLTKISIVKDPFSKLLGLLNYYTFNEEDTVFFKKIRDDFNKGQYSDMGSYNINYGFLFRLYKKYERMS